MPNWCDNDLLISGPQRDFDEFVEWLESKRKSTGKDFSFAWVHPMPEELKHSSYGNCQGEKPLTKLTEEQLKKKYGAINWYKWNIQNWATKWDIAGDDVPYHPRVRSLVMAFCTAWSPPEGAIFEFSRKFPKLMFTLHYSEPGMCFRGTFKVKDTKVIKDITRDYGAR